MGRDTDILEQILAPKDLRPWILTAVHRRDDRGGSVVVELPEVRPSIQIFLADDYWLRTARDPQGWRRAPRVGLWGPRLNWGYGYAKARIEVFAIGLTPQGVRALTDQSVGALIDRVAGLSDLNARLASALVRIATTHATLPARAGAAFLLLRSLLPQQPPVSRIGDVLQAMAAQEHCSISRAAAQLDLSDRQFRRLFRTQYGVAPKLYQRALRLDRALRALHPQPWEKHRAGETIDYADQSHMIREFLSLTGLTPQSYIRNKRRHGDKLLRTVIVEGIAPPHAARRRPFAERGR
ncbi:MAG: AraC family transcriptional regulator [Micropepsaceae bacterium]